MNNELASGNVRLTLVACVTAGPVMQLTVDRQIVLSNSAVVAAHLHTCDSWKCFIIVVGKFY